MRRLREGQPSATFNPYKVRSVTPYEILSKVVVPKNKWVGIRKTTGILNSVHIQLNHYDFDTIIRSILHNN